MNIIKSILTTILLTSSLLAIDTQIKKDSAFSIDMRTMLTSMQQIQKSGFYQDYDGMIEIGTQYLKDSEFIKQQMDNFYEHSSNINQVISQINEAIGSIASAIEDVTASSLEISNNTEDVSKSVSDVANIASNQADVSNLLNLQVSKFKI